MKAFIEPLITNTMQFVGLFHVSSKSLSDRVPVADDSLSAAAYTQRANFDAYQVQAWKRLSDRAGVLRSGFGETKPKLGDQIAD